jgi:hypothetical protein
MVATAVAVPSYTNAAQSTWNRRGNALADSERLMDAHKFRVGQTVQFRTKPFYVSAALGAFEVIRQLPERDGEFEYRIKNVAEPHERVARESELSIE